MRMYTNWYSSPAELPDEFTYPDQGAGETQPIAIAAKSKIFSVPHEISREIIQQVEQKQMRLYFYGWANYLDVFLGTPRHRTEFCHEVDTIQAHGDTVLLPMRSYRNHNSADEECDKNP